MMLLNSYGDVGWVVSLEPVTHIYDTQINYVAYSVEWNHGTRNPVSTEGILKYHQNLLDYERQHGL